MEKSQLQNENELTIKWLIYLRDIFNDNKNQVEVVNKLQLDSLMNIFIDDLDKVKDIYDPKLLIETLNKVIKLNPNIFDEYRIFKRKYLINKITN